MSSDAVTPPSLPPSTNANETQRVSFAARRSVGLERPYARVGTQSTAIIGGLALAGFNNASTAIEEELEYRRRRIAVIYCIQKDGVCKFKEEMPSRLQARMANTVFLMRIKEANKSLQKRRNLNEYSDLWNMLFVVYVLVIVTVVIAVQLPTTSVYNIALIAPLVPLWFLCRYLTSRRPKHVRELEGLLKQWSDHDSGQSIRYELNRQPKQNTLFGVVLSIDILDDSLSLATQTLPRPSTASRFGRPSIGNGLPRYHSPTPSYSS
ncbi:hypothetical protein BDR26DRAFT_955822 [Obelidium mucronatum]|nr:hypothetical protein BDR26DRAFT_955822 [Obelidium mucronatum]